MGQKGSATGEASQSTDPWGLYGGEANRDAKKRKAQTLQNPLEGHHRYAAVSGVHPRHKWSLGAQADVSVMVSE